MCAFVHVCACVRVYLPYRMDRRSANIHTLAQVMKT